MENRDFRFHLDNSEKLNSTGDYKIRVTSVNGDEVRGQIIEGPPTGTSGKSGQANQDRR